MAAEGFITGIEKQAGKEGATRFGCVSSGIEAGIVGEGFIHLLRIYFTASILAAL
jgi:hypothetical protein